jgi:drug/metabolite transporter (DMT)-like permease
LTEGDGVTNRNISGLCAAGLFILAIAIALVGADKPPPPGFLWLVGLIGILCVVAFFRLQRHLAASRSGRWVTGLRVGLEGMAGGGLVMLVLALFGTGEPSVTVSTGDRLVGAGAAALMGAVLALLIWAAAVRFKARNGMRS